MAVVTTGLPSSPGGSFLASKVILNIGLVTILVAIPFAVVSRSTVLAEEIPLWVIAAAIIALGIGVPHGAVDHVTMSRSLPRHQLIGLGFLYLLIAAAATAAVIAAPAFSFVVVLAVTIWHFGTGDVEAAHELDGTPQERGPLRILHALAVGSAPVLLPLTSPAAVNTLTLIQPQLAELFTPTTIVVIRATVLTLVVITMVLLIHREQTRATWELAALTAVGYFVTPLLAFAIYFGLWHALRHTARLAQHSYGVVTVGSIAKIFAQGIPALIGFIVVVGILAANSAALSSTGTWLWFGLALVWGLTVPHMLMVSAFDRRQREAV
jgi:beta-carotene 15,15'-dioxygenase